MSHYKVFYLNKEVSPTYTVDDLKGIFSEGKADEMNLVMLSTSGVHGSYCNLDDDHLFEHEDEDGKKSISDVGEITILVIHPRLVCLKYGTLTFKRDEIPWLRALVTSSVEAFARSQAHNVMKET